MRSLIPKRILIASRFCSYKTSKNLAAERLRFTDPFDFNKDVVDDVEANHWAFKIDSFQQLDPEERDKIQELTSFQNSRLWRL